MDRSLDFKMWSYLIFPTLLLLLLGFPKLALLYIWGNETYWEEEDEEEDEMDIEENLIDEDYNELEYGELPFFIAPEIIYSDSINNQFEEAWNMLSANLLFRNFFHINSKFSIIFWLDWKKFFFKTKLTDYNMENVYIMKILKKKNNYI